MGEGWPWNEKTHILLLPRILPSLSVPICKLGLYLPLQGCCGGLRNIVIPDLTHGGPLSPTLQGFESGSVKPSGSPLLRSYRT